ncbi:P-loop containing nucleoside triphosphate hydrolase protein [Xylaria sp. FL0933]|nr:P-loop containing nucleoside triphosphate hydrolase protein [Xylaria sp. FL0933]
MEPTFTNNVSSKSQRVSQRTSTAEGPSKGRGASSSGMPKESKRRATKRDAKSAGNASMTTGKRKRAGAGTSTDGNPNKKPKTGSKRKDARRKLEIKNQLGNMGDWSLMTPQKSEYTDEQYKREEAELSEAKLILGSKYTNEGQEQGCGNELGRIRGMSSTIRDFQTVGAAFMVRQERSRNECRGGIIADDMGIGKTVQAIACMQANPPSKKALRDGQSANLIVVPNQGIGTQWGHELERHANIPIDNVCSYVGGGKTTALTLRAHPYIIATYSQVERDFRLFNSGKKNEKGRLFEVEFYRIILDEGDNIKNYNGSTSKACANLKAKFKWVLSGTPLRNSVNECLPYFRFLGIDIHEHPDEFANKWGQPESNRVHDRIMQILAKRMLRREAGQIYLRREMCELPSSHFEDKLIPITDEEKIVSSHLQQAMRRAEEESTLEEGNDTDDQDEDEEIGPEIPKSNFWVRQARLRQASDHPFLLESCIKDFMNPHEIERLVSELGKIELKENLSCKIPRSDDIFGSQPGGLSIYQIALDIKHHIYDVMLSRNNDENGGCIECFTMAELQSLECGHVMCRACYRSQIGAAATEHRSKLKCFRCGKTVACIPTIKAEPDDIKCPPRREPMKPRNEVLQTTDGRSVSVYLPSEVNKRSPGDDFNGVQPRSQDLSSRWLKKCDDEDLITISTKTKIAIEIVTGWQKEAPDDKIVIFTEWITTAKVLGRLLNRFHIKFVYYNGQISVKSRDKNLNDFKCNSDIKVIVMTMGAGNCGLNITNANRMVIMNPWWNHAAEAQAFGRIKRFGQRKETYLIRLFAKDTIDERIYKLQNDKKEEIGGAMSQGKKPKPLSREEKHWLLTNRYAEESPLAENDDTLKSDDSESDDDSADDASDYYP